MVGPFLKPFFSLPCFQYQRYLFCTMPVCWTTLLRHLNRHGYLRHAGSAGGPGSALGPLGRLLLRNLTALWRRDVELDLNVPVVPVSLPAGCLSGQPLTAAVSELAAVQRSLSLSPPFGLCSEQPITGQLTPPDQLVTSSSDGDQLTAAASDRLSLLLAVPSTSSADWFQTLQRRRRIWWRELAEDPGNYSLAQPSPDVAQVLFDGELVVERLRSHGQQRIDADGTPHQPHLVSCEVCLQSALYAVCGDALDGGSLRLSERLAPYRRAVLSHADRPDELQALAVHVANQFRAAGVPVFPLPSGPLGDTDTDTEPSSPENTEDDHTAAEERWQAAALRSADGAGVPLTVLLSERTLRDGVCQLRSRDTTLSHQAHVSQLTDVRL